MQWKQRLIKEIELKIEFHHVNLCTSDVPGMDTFYRDVLDMQPESSMEQFRVRSDDGYDGNVAFHTDGNIQFHHSQTDMELGFRTGQQINPLERGHLAFRTDDIAAFKQRLTEKGIPFCDFGDRFMSKWQQVFFYDPAGNIIEVHQVHE